MKDRTLVFLATVCFLCTLSFSPLSGIAQASKMKPNWASEGYHKDLEKSYLEVVVIKGEQNLTKMRQMAQTEIESRRHSTVGVKDEIWMKAKPVAEYFDNDGTGYFLYQTQKFPNIVPESVSSTDRYPFSARVFVPGMEQIYKGCYGKGVAFIAGEAVLVGGIITTEFMRRNYSQKVAQTHNVSQKESYTRNANACAITRNVLIGGAAALYIWNIIDGVVAKGRPYIKVNNKTTLTFAPTVSSECTGIVMNLKF